MPNCKWRSHFEGDVLIENDLIVEIADSISANPLNA
jgi:hypothetical protein